MNELFLKIMNMSIAASWLILAVLILRLMLRKAPKWVNVLLWGIVAVRLICPFSIESALSLIPSAETIPMNIEMDTTPAINSGINEMNSVVNPIISQSNTPMDGASVNPLQIAVAIAGNIWILGAAALLIYTAVSYRCLRGKVDTAVLYEDNIFQSENVSSPFVLGIVKPRIYLPFNMNGRDLEHVVAHEQAHIRRKDHWWKPAGFLLLTIHWFNPLMWLAYALLCRDIELACDEKVIKELSNEQRADYTQALVACSVSRGMIAACPLAFGEVGVKERVKSVMNYKKPAFRLVALAVIACAAVAACFLTNPRQERFAVKIVVPAGSQESYIYSDEEISPTKDRIIITAGEHLGDTEVILKPIEVRRENAYDEPVYLTPGMPVTMDAEKGGWFKIGVNVQNPAKEDLVVYVNVENVEVRISDKASMAGKWFDYLEAPEEMNWDGSLEINVPEFPDVTFRWYPERMEAVTDKEILPLYNGMPIWNTYFCDLTGDGLPELCSTFTYGSGMIDSRVILYDYANGASYMLEDRGHYDYTLRLNDSDGRLYVDQKVYGSDELVTTGPLMFADGGIRAGFGENNADPLDAAISAAILQHDAADKPNGLIHVESHKLLANESFATAGSRQSAETEGFAVYLLVLEQSYSSLDGVLKEVAGSYTPAAITFSVTETGEYAVKDYWIPRDGSYYAEDVREKFPKMAAEEALNGQAYVEQLQEECYQRALDVMNSHGSLSVKIANLLDIVQSSPSAASAPSAYIRAHNDEWEELLSYGEYSLRYCFAQFLQGGQTDLKGKLMQQLCCEIMESQGYEQPETDCATGQDWFDGFREEAERIADEVKYSNDYLEKNEPFVWLLIEQSSETDR